jgi:hypothetical protein
MERASWCGCPSWSGAVWRLFFGVAGDDLVFDLVVSGLREDASGNELILGGVGAAVDDSLRVGVANSGECLELVGCCGIDVQGRGGCGSGGSAGFGALGNGEYRDDREQERGGKEFVMKIEHRVLLLWAECFTAEEYESVRAASMNKFASGGLEARVSGLREVDFSGTARYPEGEMSRLHLHHGHSHHHAKSVLAAVSGVAK